MKQRRFKIFLLAAALMLLCACGKATETPPEAGTPETAPESLPDESAQPLTYEESFINTAGNIEISIKADSTESFPASMPVLKARPRVLDLEQARLIAAAVFGESPLYEYSAAYSKAELKALISSMEYGVTDAAIRASYGEDISPADLESVRSGRLEILEYYRSAYEFAQDELRPQECQWKFWPDYHYSILEHDYAGNDPSYTGELPYGVSVELQAQSTIDGVSYHFWVNNREADDFRNHSVSIFPQSPTPTMTEDDYIKALGLGAADEPTQKQIDAALQKATELTEKMNIGQWSFSAEAQQGYFACEGYFILVSGQPVYEGCPVITSRAEISTGNSNYYYENLEIIFSPDGRLVSIQYLGPLEVTETLDPAAPLLSFEAMQETISRHFSEASPADYANYCLLPPERLAISVDGLELGLAREKLDGTYFTLTPAITLKGSLIFSGEDELYETSPEVFRIDGANILTLSLIDGHVIRP